MLPKIIYKQAYKDVMEAFLKGKLDTKEWISREKAIYAEFQKDYLNESLMEE